MKNRHLKVLVRNRDESDDRKIVFVASTDSVDSYRTVLNQQNWVLDRFNDSPIIGFNHDVIRFQGWEKSDPDDSLGSARAWVEDNQLLIEVDFDPVEINPKAEKIFRKLKRGSLNEGSVSFDPIGEGRLGDESRGEDPQVYYFAGQELVEFSIVTRGSNPDAKKRSVNKAVSFLLENIEDLTEEEKESMRSVLIVKPTLNESKLKARKRALDIKEKQINFNNKLKKHV